MEQINNIDVYTSGMQKLLSMEHSCRKEVREDE